MTSLLKYLEANQQVTFDEKPLNEVDILILNELTYLPFDNYLTDDIDFDHPMKINHLYTQYWLKHEEHQNDNSFLATTSRHQLFTAVAASRRYEEIHFSNFTHRYSQSAEIQFCALTLHHPNNTLQISFRGTDDTLIGWKEDLKLSYLDEIPAQKDAKDYLEMIANLTKQELIVSGHSKGGALALYACGQAQIDQSQIKDIYLFDSPGLLPTLVKQEKFQSLANKIHRYIPEDTIVGAMMYHVTKPIIFKSSLISLLQHNVVHWQVDDDQLVRSENTTNTSKTIDLTLKRWTDMYGDQELEFFVEQLFTVIGETGVTTLNEISKDLFAFLKSLQNASKNVTQEEKDKYSNMEKSLIACWNDVQKEFIANKWDEFQTNVKEFVNQMTGNDDSQ